MVYMPCRSQYHLLHLRLLESPIISHLPPQRKGYGVVKGFEVLDRRVREPEVVRVLLLSQQRKTSREE